MTTFYEKAWSERVQSESRALVSQQRARPASVAGRQSPSLGAVLAAGNGGTPSQGRTHASATAGNNRSEHDLRSLRDNASVATSVARHQKHTAAWLASYQPPAAAVGSSVEYRTALPPVPSGMSTRKSTASSSVFSATTLPSRTASLGLSVATSARNRIDIYEATLKQNASKMAQYEEEMRALKGQIEELRRIATQRPPSAATPQRSGSSSRA